MFYGGGKKDIEYLSKDFQTVVAINRAKASKKISATLIRNYLKDKNFKKLKEFINPHVIPLAVKGYQMFLRSRLTDITLLKPELK